MLESWSGDDNGTDLAGLVQDGTRECPCSQPQIRDASPKALSGGDGDKEFGYSPNPRSVLASAGPWVRSRRVEWDCERRTVSTIGRLVL